MAMPPRLVWLYLLSTDSMTNLLPQPALKRVRRERTVRFFIVLFFVLAFVGFATLLMMLPTFLLLNYQKVEAGSDSSLFRAIKSQRAAAERELTTTRKVVEHLRQENKTKNHSSLIDNLDEIAGNEVTIEQLVFDDKGKLTLNGKATTRASLSSFRNKIEASKLFKKVELPLANLADEVNPEFSMTLTLK